MKLKLIFSALITLVAIQYTYSQTLISLAKPFKGDNWGYINTQGEFIIEPKYRKAFEFSEEGYAVVLEGKSKQYEFINTKGEKLNTDIKEFKLKEMFGMSVKGFTSGMVPVRIGEKWGFLNLQGKEGIKPTFDKVTEFNEGYAWGQRNGLSFILDKTGKETSTDPKVFVVKEFKEGLAPFESQDKKEGFVNNTGKIVIEAKYHSVGYFSDGLAWAKLPEGKIGYIDKKGEWVIEPQFSAAKNFDPKSGLARVKVEDKWQYVDKTGKVATLNDAETFEDFSEGLCAGKKDGKVGFYDNTGKWVIEPKFDAVRDFKNGYAAAKLGGKWGMINKTGGWVFEPTFGGIKDMEAVK